MLKHPSRCLASGPSVGAKRASATVLPRPSGGTRRGPVNQASPAQPTRRRSPTGGRAVAAARSDAGAGTGTGPRSRARSSTGTGTGTSPLAGARFGVGTGARAVAGAGTGWGTASGMGSASRPGSLRTSPRSHSRCTATAVTSRPRAKKAHGRTGEGRSGAPSARARRAGAAAGAPPWPTSGWPGTYGSAVWKPGSGSGTGRAAAFERSRRAAKPDRSTLPVRARAGATGAADGAVLWAVAAAVVPGEAVLEESTVVEEAGAGTSTLGDRLELAVTPLVVPGPAERTAATWYW